MHSDDLQLCQILQAMIALRITGLQHTTICPGRREQGSPVDIDRVTAETGAEGTAAGVCPASHDKVLTDDWEAERRPELHEATQTSFQRGVLKTWKYFFFCCVVTQSSSTLTNLFRNAPKLNSFGSTLLTFIIIQDKKSHKDDVYFPLHQLLTEIRCTSF